MKDMENMLTCYLTLQQANLYTELPINTWNHSQRALATFWLKTCQLR